MKPNIFQGMPAAGMREALRSLTQKANEKPYEVGRTEPWHQWATREIAALRRDVDCLLTNTPDRSGEADKTAKLGLAEGESGLPRKGSSKP
jgi:hypothetical protein